ncbi:AbrB/MazE/SpoVT family DNA-binding domain-containing protein [Dyadobacter sp. BHUBP1]|uniref:AbrB/MazE/SpoVT family DNA-binding domain-containing protein n=1 Tax=Dyadobacter sp. BHUBP1 TaxID=3424178 RepID=UPI003D344D0C
MLTKIRRIGNSQGILLSKTMLDQVDIEEYVNVEIKGNAIMIFPATTNPREGWAEQFRLAAEDATVSDDENLMDDGPNAFDDSEWTW